MDFSDSNPFMVCARWSAWKNLSKLSCIYDQEKPELSSAHEVAYDLRYGIFVPVIKEAHRAFYAGDETGQQLELLVKIAAEGRMLLVKCLDLLACDKSSRRMIKALSDDLAESDEMLREYSCAIFIAPDYNGLEYTLEHIDLDVDKYLQEWWMARERLDRTVPENVVTRALADLTRR